MATNGENAHVPSPSPPEGTPAQPGPPKCELCASTLQPPPPAYEPRGSDIRHCHCRCHCNCDNPQPAADPTNQSHACEAGTTTDPKRPGQAPPHPLSSCLGSLVVLAAIAGAIYGFTQWAKHENHQAAVAASSRSSEQAA